MLFAISRCCSPLENHHLAAAFKLMRHPDFNFLSALPKAEFEKFRKVVIELVLATDMKQHFSILSHFTTVHRCEECFVVVHSHKADIETVSRVQGKVFDTM
jgi:hypothetical protein